jgi:tripartite ATP-independent transporter DctP family solute receptor
MPTIGRRQLTQMALTGTGAALAAPLVARHGLGATPAHRLKMTMADNSTHPIYPVLTTFAADVLKRTNGAVDIKVYGAGQLGSQVNALTGMQTGIIDLVCHTSGFMETIYPAVSVLDLPYIFKTSAEAEHVLDGPVGQQLFDLFPAKGIYGLCWGHWGWRPVTHSSRDMHEPKDIAGSKIRIQPGAIYAATYKALSATPIVVDITEVYLALSQHAVDAVEVPLMSLLAGKLYEVAKHVSLTNFVYNAGAILASKRNLDALPKPYQQAIRDAALAISPGWRQAVAQKTDEAAAFVKAQGGSVVEVDQEAYAKALAPVYAEYRSVIGPELVDAILKQTGRA